MASSKPTKDVSLAFQEMSIGTDDVNMLLLGETGIGKSTFINAFANYLHYKSFELAEKNEVKCLVPAKFEITDTESGEFKRKVVSIGDDTNENTSMINSATQTARSYVFPLPSHGGRKFRLIDTPGICDDRGIDQDKQNLENILSYIGKLEHLHAICILMKPNNARLTVSFQYCVTQLLARLDKTAGGNIIFVFTNSRTSFYKPGDTSAAIIKILEDIAKNPPHVEIKFAMENVFCLDNESFRYLAAVKQGINLSNKSSFTESWKHSAVECIRLINYVIGEGPRKLIPHQVSRTISINKARQVILELSKPLADITEHIDDNVHVLQQHQKSMKTDNLSIEDLKTKLYVPGVSLELIECTQPKTVCANAKCCESVAVGEVYQQHYKQRCHDPCYLSNIPKEIIGDAGLVHCAAMDGSGQCKRCGCNFSAHMHIYYETKKVNIQIEGSGIKAQITDRETAVQATKKIIQDIEKTKNELEAEKKTVIKAMAKFAYFLKNNAILPFNDSYKAYIEYLIQCEHSRPVCHIQTIQNLEKLLKQYDEEKMVLENAVKNSTGFHPAHDITADKILKEIQQLYALKHTGSKIKGLHKLQKRGGESEHKNTEYVLSGTNAYDSDISIGSSEDNRPKRNNKKNPKKGKGNNTNNKNVYNGGNNNQKGGPRKEKFQNEKPFNNQGNYLNNQLNPQEFRGNPQQRNYQKHNNQSAPQGNWGFPQGNHGPQHYMQNPHGNIPSLLQMPMIPPNQPGYYQGMPMNYQHQNFGMPYDNPQHSFPMNYPNISPNVNNPNQWQANPLQSFQGYNAPHPPSRSNQGNQNAPPNNIKNLNKNNNKKEYEELYGNKNYKEGRCNKEYDELYGNKQHKVQYEARRYNPNDSDSDNESTEGFNDFLKRTGVDRQNRKYGEYGDDDESTHTNSGFLFSFTKLFK